MFNRKGWHNNLLGLIVFSNLGIFLLNNVLFHSSTLSVLYVVVVLITLFYPKKKITISTAILATALVIAESLIQLDQLGTKLITTNISIGGGIWMAAYFILRYKSGQAEDFKNKERLKALFEYATEGILIADSTGTIIMVNPKASKLFGYENNELLGQKIEILIPDRISGRHVKHREGYNKDPHPRPMGNGMPLYARKKGGEEFPVEISLSNFKTDEGSFVISFIIDITDRQISEQLIRKEKELVQMYLDITPVVFVVLDINGNITLINQYGCRILGYTESQLIGKNWFETFLDEKELENLKGKYSRIMNEDESFNSIYENTILTKSGESRIMAWKNTTIRDEKGMPVSMLSAGEDITERKSQEILIEKANTDLKKYNEQVNQLNEDLEQRVISRTNELDKAIKELKDINTALELEVSDRKMAEEKLQKNREELSVAYEKEKELGELKTRFVTMASHEFRTPLSTILSSVSLISKYNLPEQEEKKFKHIDRIKSSVNNLTSILNDFLSIGKLEEGKTHFTPSDFNIVHFSSDIVNELKDVCKKGQLIEHVHRGTIIDVKLDKNLTRNICLNLISNAIKYSPEGAVIRFTTDTEQNNLQIKVQDQGIGIPENEQIHMFERFFRAKNASNIQGTGLGLNIVKKYSEIMNGNIQFNSKLNEGSTFIVNLPLLLGTE